MHLLHMCWPLYVAHITSSFVASSKVSHMPAFVHIPKSGGTSVRDMYLAANIPFFADKISHDRYLIKDNKMSESGLHKPSNYANAPKPTWCIIRDPIDRAVSSYNMRNLPRVCNAIHFNEWIVHNFIEENERDGHFFASVAYLPYCTLPILYEKAHEMVAAHLNVTMPHVTFGSTHICTRNHLGDHVKYALMKKYKEDIRLRQAMNAIIFL